MANTTTKQQIALRPRPIPKALKEAAGLLKGKLNKYAVSFDTKTTQRRTFFNLAKKHIVKGKKGGRRDLSRKIDEIAYRV